MDYAGKYFELCVLIPCYNNLPGLKQSLSSIRYHKNKFLVLVVDDGSIEPVRAEDILVNGENGFPVHLIRLNENKGITIALNTGLQWIRDHIRCTYIARLDCADICDSQRFYLQLNFLSENTDIELLGSWCYFQDPKKRFNFKHRSPEHHKAIRKAMYFRNVFIHPTVVFRATIFDKVGLYPEDYPCAEDYALFWKITNVAKTAVMPLYLVVCEVNKKGISYSNRIKQLESRLVILKKFGHKFAFKCFGILKLKILMKIPYTFVLHVKKLK